MFSVRVFRNLKDVYFNNFISPGKSDVKRPRTFDI